MVLFHKQIATPIIGNHCTIAAMRSAVATKDELIGYLESRWPAVHWFVLVSAPSNGLIYLTIKPVWMGKQVDHDAILLDNLYWTFTVSRAVFTTKVFTTLEQSYILESMGVKKVIDAAIEYSQTTEELFRTDWEATKEQDPDSDHGATLKEWMEDYVESTDEALFDYAQNYACNPVPVGCEVDVAGMPLYMITWPSCEANGWINPAEIETLTGETLELSF